MLDTTRRNSVERLLDKAWHAPLKGKCIRYGSNAPRQEWRGAVDTVEHFASQLTLSSRTHRRGLALAVIVGAWFALTQDARGQVPVPVDQPCVPDCRDGYVCYQGACISACNPPCPGGQTCTGTGQCIDGQPPTPAPVMAPPVAAPAPVAAAPASSPAQPPDAEPPSPAPPPDDAYYPEPAAPSPSSDSAFGFFVNVLGVLQFGPEVGLEFGKRLAGMVYARPMNLGALSYLVIAEGDYHEFKWGIGGGAGLRLYLSTQGARRGWYLGANLEYVRLSIDGTEPGYRWEEDDSALLIIPHIGYRWVWGSFLLGAGGWVGYYTTLSAERLHIDEYDWRGKHFDEGEIEDVSTSGVRGGLMLELGTMF